MMTSDGDDETLVEAPLQALKERNLQLERRLENLERQKEAVPTVDEVEDDDVEANKPDKSKYLDKRLLFYTIIACVAIFVGVVTTLAVMLNKSSSSDTTTNTQQESESPPLPGPTTMAPTFDGALLDPTAMPSTALPTGNPSTTPSDQPVDPSCQVVYPSIPNLSCVSREEYYGRDAIYYQFSVDCDAYGDYQAQTGLWESGRTMGTLLGGDWVKLQLIDRDVETEIVDNVRWQKNGSECWFSFRIETEYTPSCMRIQLHDDLCSSSYTSDCFALANCDWD
jgi:hypothetical protein